MIKVERLESFQENVNPFNYDAFHMGTSLGDNIMIMHSTHPGEQCSFLIVVNKETGERLKLVFDELESNKIKGLSSLFNAVKKVQ